MSNDGSGTYWDEAAPANDDPGKDGASEIRDLRQGIRIRLGQEWNFPSTTTATHTSYLPKQGSALLWLTSVEPTQRPDGATSLDSDDIGRLWVDSSDESLYYYKNTTSGFERVHAPADAIPSNAIGSTHVTTSGIILRHLTDGILASNTTAQAKMADGFLSADTTGRAKMADGFVNDDKIASGVISPRNYVRMTETRGTGVNGGSLTATTWNDLLNTEESDTDTICNAGSLPGFVLDAGTYEVSASAVAVANASANVKCRLRLYNTTDSSVLLAGPAAEVASKDSSRYGAATAVLSGRFTIAASKTVKLQFYVSAASVNGEAVGDGSDEVYSELTLYKFS